MNPHALPRFLAATTTALLIAVSGTPIPAVAASAPDPVIEPVRQCGELEQRFDLPGATTHVTSAKVNDQSEPAYCDVQGRIEPAVTFRLRLPLDTFTGRYLQYGCGAFCGRIPELPFPDCGGDLGGDVAVGATDDGHVSEGPDERWAADDQTARNDYFYRAPHVLSVAAKRIIAEFYGAPPKRSYFSSCSNGGREGLLLAQRYPRDFDGVIAGAPAHAMGPLFGVYAPWLARTNTAADGEPILTDAKLPALHGAVVAACDRLDGLADGQIDDPRACRFDPVTAQCPAGTDQADCLTPRQVAVVRALYAGPVDPDGRRLYPGWQTRGSELGWEGMITPASYLGNRSFAAWLGDNYLKYAGFPIGTPHSSLAEASFTAAGFHRLTAEGVKGNAMSLDLRAFRRAGGKLILWHGWADPLLPATATVDYYQRLSERNGGLRETQRWARLFMVPTMSHCGSGYRLTEFDPLRELVTWVERDTAPTRVIAVGRDAQGAVSRSRPVFPHPLVATYDGTGSIDDAANFVPAPPRRPSPATIRWIGSHLHELPGPVAP
ncbi:tannase/feruloyl esterase family alpha/beta hydrolase [Nonomuraea sp. ZG12]|uniref:tannase/feruloyl esterase family alpha/beta hydrolase n=1 Tax=Nonomuraea sp. ZG12 TaxID=3452207 RepID=UPI003F8C55FB